MTDRELWQALGYRVEKRSLGVCGDGYVLLLPDGGYGPGCGEGRGWGNEPAAWAQLPSADTWEGAGLIVEAMHNQLDENGSGYYLALMYRAPDWAASFWLFIGDKDPDWYCHPERYPASARGDTAPCAVRLAALRALGVSEE